MVKLYSLPLIYPVVALLKTSVYFKTMHKRASMNIYIYIHRLIDERALDIAINI